MEIDKRQQSLIIAITLVALVLSSLLLINPKLGRALVTRPLKIQPGQHGLASIAPNNPGPQSSDWTHAGSQANLDLNLH